MEIKTKKELLQNKIQQYNIQIAEYYSKISDLQKKKIDCQNKINRI